MHRTSNTFRLFTYRTRALLFAFLFAASLTGCQKEEAEQQVPKSDTESIAELRTELRDNLNDADLRLRLARLYLQQGDGPEAESHFRRAQKLNSVDPNLQSDLVRSLLMQKEAHEALEIVEERIPQFGQSVPALWWMLRGEAQLGLIKFNKAEVRHSFLNAFQENDEQGDPATAQHLEQLSAQYPAVAAAKAHMQCRYEKAKPVAPEIAQAASGRTIKVGPDFKIKTPSQAAKIAKDGDLIEISAGVYRGDVAIWRQNYLVLRGVGGPVELRAAGKHADGKAIWVFEGNNITAENIHFYDAKVRHRNGAGIRLQGRSATIRNCHFENNENGILGSHVDGSHVLVEFSTFINNGYGDGQSHNIYIGRAQSFTMRYSYSVGANVGHLVKSRAFNNSILFNRLVDGVKGNSSYVINLPEGGRAWIVGNELQQGPKTENPIMISFGEEAAVREEQALYIVNNTFYNRQLNGTFIRNSADIDAVIANNIFSGAPAIALRGKGTQYANIRGPEAGLVNPRELDFALTEDASAIDAGTDLGKFANELDANFPDGLVHYPHSEYVHPAQGRRRQQVDILDAGAREFCAVPE